MNLSVIVTIGLNLALVFGAPSNLLSNWRVTAVRLTQASADAPGSPMPNDLPDLSLDAAQKRIIYDRIASEHRQTLPDDPQLAIGDGIPDSIILDAIPVSVKDQVAGLRDFKFVKTTDGKILLVDPATRKIIDFITKQDAGR